MKAIRKIARFVAGAMSATALALPTRAETPSTAMACIAPTTLPVTCEGDVQRAFDLAMALLRAQVFPVAASAFREVLKRDPDCAMGHWGVAMAAMGDVRGTGPAQRALAEGAAANAHAKGLGGRSVRERELIDAAAEYFDRAHERDHATRVHAFEVSLRRAKERFPDDADIGAFHERAFEALVNH